MNTTPISSAKQAADAADFAAFWAEHGQVERSDTQKFWLWLLRVLGVEQAETFIEFEESARMDEAHGFIDAHRANDRAVMSAYGFDAKMTESDCVAALFRLYERLAGKGPA